MTRLVILLTMIALGGACADSALATSAGAAHHDGVRNRARAVCLHAARRSRHSHTRPRAACGRRNAHRSAAQGAKGGAVKLSSEHANQARRVPGSRLEPGNDKRAKRTQHAGKEDTVVVLNRPSAAATIARVLDTPCENTELMPEAGNLAAIEAAMLCLINQERARNEELPLQANTQLTEVAQSHSEDMLAEDYFAHVTPSGETQLQRVQASGYIPNSQVGYAIGENIAWGTLSLATPQAIVSAWIASPEHLENILNAEYRDSGIGVVAAVPASFSEGQPGATYTQDFGAIIP